jgi:hypothetical protein
MKEDLGIGIISIIITLWVAYNGEQRLKTNPCRDYEEFKGRMSLAVVVLSVNLFLSMFLKWLHGI